MTMAYLASLDYIFCDAGLFALLTHSDVYAHDTARQMLQEKQYARGLRGIRIVQEALFQCFYLSMEPFLRQQGRDSLVEGLDNKIEALNADISTND